MLRLLSGVPHGILGGRGAQPGVDEAGNPGVDQMVVLGGVGQLLFEIRLPLGQLRRAVPRRPSDGGSDNNRGWDQGGAPDQWIDWGLPLQDGMTAHVTVSNAGQALSSALAGLGKAILPELLAKESIEAGKLEVLDGPHTGTRAYWLVAPTPQWRTKKVKSLVSFLSVG